VNAAARFISIVFHPLLLATYLFSLFYFILPSAWAPVPLSKASTLLVMLLLVTFVLPAINLYFFKAMGIVSSLELAKRKERRLPFVFIALIYCAVTYLMNRYTGIYWDDTFMRFFLIIDALVIVSALITLFYRASIHALALSGIVGIFLPLNKMAEDINVFYATLGLIVLTGIVMSARLQLNAHSPREILVGSLLGLATGFAGMVILFS
jgi:hypothetical protein